MQSISLIFSVQLKSNPYQFMWNMFQYTSICFRNSKSFRPLQQKIMFQSCFNIISVPCFNHVSTVYHPCFNHVSTVYHSMFQNSINSKETVTILVGTFLFWWQITKFLNNYHISKHIYGNFIPLSWTWSCFDFHSWQT